MRLPLIVVAVVAAVWLAPLFLSVESGLRFGWPYQIFFTLVVLFGGFVFYMLRAKPTPPFKSTGKAFGSMVLVFLGSIGVIVLLANVAPQFGFEETSAGGATAEERGRALFSNPNVGCFLCHTIAGSGGTRGPDLSHVASVAGKRRPGVSAEDYLKESLQDPAAFVVPTFDKIMPPFAQRLSSEELADLLTYLLSLK
ncbi:MAG: cytochrome c [Chloroflexi bacterium]|nr:cytochrome c [Chloroflexota bacterium]